MEIPPEIEILSEGEESNTTDNIYKYLLNIAKEDPTQIQNILRHNFPINNEEAQPLSQSKIEFLQKLFFCDSYNSTRKQEEISRIDYKSPICGLNFEECDIMWECADCAKVFNSCYCDSCFIKTEHIGHDYYFKLLANGCCDCGDQTVLDPETFCSKHRLQEEDNTQRLQSELLPEYILQAGPQVINHIAQCLFHCSLKCGPQRVLDTNYANIEPMVNGLMAFADIYRTSQLFLPWIVNALTFTFAPVGEDKVTHLCTPMHFGTYQSIQGNSNKEGGVLMEDIDITGGNVNIAMNTNIPEDETHIHHLIASHDCKCSLLDRLMPGFYLYADYERIREMLSEIAKLSSSFSELFHHSYFANYDYIIQYPNKKYNDYCEKFEIILCQMMTPQVISSLIQKTVYFEKYIKSFTSYPLLLNEEERPDSGKIYYMLYHIHCDFIFHIIKGKENAIDLLENTKFMTAFIAAIGDIQFANPVEPRTTHIEFEKFGLKYNFFTSSHYVTEMFTKLIRKYDFSSPKLTKIIAEHLRYHLEKSFEREEQITSRNQRYIIIPLNRCLAVFLLKVIGTKFAFIPKRESIQKLRLFIQSLFNFETENEMHIFLHKIINITLNVIDFANELASGKWINYGSQSVLIILEFYRERSESFCYHKIDLALLQLLLPLCDYRLYSDKFHIDFDQILKSSTMDNRTKDSKYIEEKLYTLCTLISNDLSYSEMYLKTKIEETNKKTKETDISYLKHVLLRIILSNLLPQGIKKVLFFNFNEELNKIPDYLGTPEVEDIIKDNYCTPTVRGGKQGFEINKEILCKSNIWNSYDGNRALNSELTMQEIKSKLNLENSVLNVLSPRLDDIPYTYLLLNEIKLNLLKSGLLVLMIKIFISEENVMSSDGIKLFSLKIIYDLVMLTTFQDAEFGKEAKQLIFGNNLQVSEDLGTLKRKLEEFLKENKQHTQQIKQIIRVLYDQDDPQGTELEEEKLVKFGQEESKSNKIKEIQDKIRAEFLEKRQKFMLPSNITEEEKKEDIKCEYCSYCKEELNEEKYEKSPYGKIGLITTSCTYIKSLIYSIKTNPQTNSKLREYIRDISIIPDINWVYPKYFSPRLTLEDTQISLCSHYMHYECLKQYREGGINTFLCPLCKASSNTLAPILLRPLSAHYYDYYGREENILFIEYINAILIDMFTLHHMMNYQINIPSPLGFDFNLYSVKIVENMLFSQISHLQLIDVLGIREFYRQEYHFILCSQLNLLLTHTARKLVTTNVNEDDISISVVGKEISNDGLEYLNRTYIEMQKFKQNTIFGSKMEIHSMLSLYLPFIIEYAKTEYKNSSLTSSEDFIKEIELVIRNIIIQSALTLLLNRNELLNIPTTTQKLMEEIGIIIMIPNNLQIILENVFRYLNKIIALKSVIEQWPEAKITQNIQSITIGPAEEIYQAYRNLIGLKTENFFRQINLAINSNSNNSDYHLSSQLESELSKLHLVNFYNNLGALEEKEAIDNKLIYEYISLVIPELYISTNNKLKFNFIQIPRTIDQYIIQYFPKPCKKCGKSITNKYVCLLCGALVCLNSPCCIYLIGDKQYGELSAHSIACSLGNGYFFSARSGEVIIHTVNMTVSFNSLFYDNYGMSVTSFLNISSAPYKSKDLQKYFLNESKFGELKEMFILGKTKQLVQNEIAKGGLSLSSVSN